MSYASHPVAVDPCQRLTTPKPIRSTEQRSGVIVVAVRGDGVRFPAQPTELMKVDSLRIDLKYIAACPTHETHTVTHGVPE
jgi:hypothetical protein